MNAQGNNPSKNVQGSVVAILQSIALVALPILLLGGSSNAFAKQDHSVAFITHEYDNPQPTDPMFSKIWPGLIAKANKEAIAEGLPPPPGTNDGFFIDVATLPILGGKALVTIPYGAYVSKCQGDAMPQHQNEVGRALNCSARLTTIRNGIYRTKNIGLACHVATDTPPTESTSARAAYDAKTNTVHLYAMIAGKRVIKAINIKTCEHIIPLPK